MDSWGPGFLQPSGGIRRGTPSSSTMGARALNQRRNTVAASSSGYKKLFRALQACSGNVTAMTEVARDFLGTGGLLAGAVVKPDMLTTTVEKTVDFFEKLENRKPKKESIAVSRRPRPIKQPATSSGGDHHHNQQQQTGYNDPFLALANEMFVAYTNSEPRWSGGMPMSMEWNNAQSYYGRDSVLPSMAKSMEEYNAQYYGGDAVPPSMVEAMFRQPGHGSNGHYLSPEEGWATSMRGSFAGGADARSFSYSSDYHNGLTPYTTPCNDNTSNNGPMVCGFCLDSTCRCYYAQQHAGNTHIQPPPLLASEHTMVNPKTPSPSTTAISAAALGGLDQRAGGSSALSTVTTDREVQCGRCQRAVAMGYKGCGCGAYSECVKPSAALEYHTGPFTCPGQHGLTSWVILANEYTCHFCGGMIASGIPVLTCSLCQVYACPSCVWMHPSTSW